MRQTVIHYNYSLIVKIARFIKDKCFLSDMESLFEKMRKVLAETKVYIQRSMSYIAIINGGMILFLMLSQLKNFGIDIPLTQWFFPLFILSIFGAIAVGYVDVKLGFFREESGAISKRDPVLSEIKDRLQRIENKLNKSRKR